MSRYKIWDKNETIYTPAGKQYSAEEWIEKFPWTKLPNAKMVISNDIINGGFCGELSQMKKMGQSQILCKVHFGCE